MRIINHNAHCRLLQATIQALEFYLDWYVVYIYIYSWCMYISIHIHTIYITYWLTAGFKLAANWTGCHIHSKLVLAITALLVCTGCGLWALPLQAHHWWNWRWWSSAYHAISRTSSFTVAVLGGFRFAWRPQWVASKSNRQQLAESGRASRNMCDDRLWWNLRWFLWSLESTFSTTSWSRTREVCCNGCCW